MSSPSIRSFALDYYRKRGAEIRPLEGAEAFEICAPDGNLKVTFAHEAEAATLEQVNATSPQWRAILEDLTADVAVSYRYLVSGPIARPARTLEAALPDGWAVTSAKLLDVQNRVALGFTHRVTFDSPALNACREEMHSHLWDVAEERRLTALEPRLYELPCIMIRPERFPAETTVQGLLGRTLAVVDVAIEARGREIERELAVQLTESEKRTNQYFDQQMGNVLQREAALGEKLDATIRRLTEAKTPEAVARLKAEGESLAGQLEHMKVNRERELAAVEAACTAKLVTERERHELTATTDLAAICHASYDVLTYQAEVVSPDGDAMTWTVKYWPVSGAIACPPCQICDRPMERPSALGGAYVCDTCGVSCEGCGTRYASAVSLDACTHCEVGTCQGCLATCNQCHASLCEAHTACCDTCEAPVCTACVAVCHECRIPLCENHAVVAGGHVVYCDRHVPAVAEPEPEPVAIVEEAETVVAPATSVMAVRSPISMLAATAELASDVLGALPAEMALPPAADLAAEPELERLFVKREPVYSQVSGLAIHPAKAETCPCCSGHVAVQEMVDCPTCGIPSCVKCTQGPMGPCPACDSLEDAARDDARLGFVFAQFPELSKGRRWELAQLGPYVIAHWSRWGTWGMVTYHTGNAEPVVVNAFSVGRVKALGQAIGELWGR